MEFSGNQFGQVLSGANHGFGQSDCVDTSCQKKYIPPCIAFNPILARMPSDTIGLNRHVHQGQKEISKVSTDLMLWNEKQAQTFKGLSYNLLNTRFALKSKSASLGAKAANVLFPPLNPKYRAALQTGTLFKCMLASPRAPLAFLRKTFPDVLIAAGVTREYLSGSSLCLTEASIRTKSEVRFLAYGLSASLTRTKGRFLSIVLIAGVYAKLLLSLVAAIEGKDIATIQAGTSSWLVHKAPLTRVADILKRARDVSNRAFQAIDQTALARGNYNTGLVFGVTQ